MSSRLTACVLGLTLVLVGIVRAGSDDDAFKIIVNPDNHADEVSRDFLRDVFLGKATEWGNGDTVRPVDLSSRFPARDRFIRDVVRKTPSQLRTYWNQQIFSGKGVPPPEIDSTDEVIDYVVGHPGAVGYLPASVNPGRAKVVRLR